MSPPPVIGRAVTVDWILTTIEANTKAPPEDPWVSNNDRAAARNSRSRRSSYNNGGGSAALNGTAMEGVQQRHSNGHNYGRGSEATERRECSKGTTMEEGVQQRRECSNDTAMEGVQQWKVCSNGTASNGGSAAKEGAQPAPRQRK